MWAPEAKWRKILWGPMVVPGGQRGDCVSRLPLEAHLNFRPLMGPRRRQARSAPSRLGSYRRPSEQVRACLLPSQCRRGEDHLAVAPAGLTSGVTEAAGGAA